MIVLFLQIQAKRCFLQKTERQTKLHKGSSRSKKPSLNRGAAKKSGASQKKSTDVVTQEAENMRLRLVTEKPAGPQANAKAPGCKYLLSSQRRGEREENTI